MIRNETFQGKCGGIYIGFKTLRKGKQDRECTRESFTVIKSVRKVEQLYFVIKYKEAKVD